MSTDGNPFTAAIQCARRARSWSLRELAQRCGLASGAYVLSIENGEKIPTLDVALRLARELGEDEARFAAWATALASRDLATSLHAAQTLLEDPEVAAFAAGAWAPPPVSRVTEEVAGAPRLRIPLLPSGADPGEGVEPSCEVLNVLRLGSATLGRAEVFVRPFAYVVERSWAERVPALTIRHVAIVSRAPMPLTRERVFAVRGLAGVELGHVSWNGRELLIHAAPGSSDFQVLAASGERGLSERIVGHVARILESDAGAP